LSDNYQWAHRSFRHSARTRKICNWLFSVENFTSAAVITIGICSWYYFGATKEDREHTLLRPCIEKAKQERFREGKNVAPEWFIYSIARSDARFIIAETFPSVDARQCNTFPCISQRERLNEPYAVGSIVLSQTVQDVSRES
jgi:hypothetical protein